MEITLYLCPVAPRDDALLPALMPHLTAAEQDRARRFVVQPARRTHVIAHALLHHALARAGVTALAFAENAQGKPFLPGQVLHFNLSHTEGLVAVALSRGAEVGVDVELQRDMPDREGVARSVFRPEEVAGMQAGADPGARFFQVWTVKEAVMKATGLGFSLPPQEIGLSGPAPTLTTLPPEHGAPGDWWLHSDSCGPHWLALASRSPPPRVTRHALRPAALIPR
ncbi:MAG: 4'-phosphopantetheinyl transferase superfamily protein [Rhodobacteraceae bacterium]|nr:MAG: 4'-phosphopantetheinyl transferase superfamily protein [Paracoccaceae bacterium]